MLRATILTISMLCAASVARAQTDVSRLVEVIRLGEVAAILHDEGLRYAQSLDDALMGGQAGTQFHLEAARIYDTARITDRIADALSEGMTEEEVEETTVFFATELGQSILSLENSARRAISDPALEELARAYYEDLPRDDARLVQVEQYIAVNDLIDRNVEGTLSADYHFYLGMAEAGDGVRDDGSLLAQLLEGRAETEAETSTWLHSFLLLAYQPLAAEEMAENIAFSQSDSGKALNAALFDGFDRLYDEISYDLGAAMAQAMSATDL
ncbi:DUF2059 domain-containing protein [Lutimaribacter marinistellae]|uniref:DUF2059 domain-containing protein n=1 Tax=Lutimaribacter marinistellae TaxID=1820329 RepID=A0ABV7TLR3_9RHOB